MMAKAKRTHGTTGAESSDEHAATAHSEIIKQCTIYAQSSAAYEAGFCADTTDSKNFAGCGRGELGLHHFKQAKRALVRLAALSREKRPITTAELFAESRVMKLLLKTPSWSHPEAWESDFFERFTKDVVRYLEQASESS